MADIADSAGLPGEDCWREVFDWASGMEPATLASLVKGIPEDEAYRRWLMEQVQDMGCVVSPGDEATKVLKLSHFPASNDIDCGARLFSNKTMTCMARKLVIHGQWRECDVVQLCHLEGMVVGEGCSTPLLFYVKFHHRAVAMFFLMYHFYKTGKTPPKFLSDMASAIQLKFLGTLSRDDALARNFARTTSMLEGSVKQSWLEVDRQARAAASDEYIVCSQAARQGGFVPRAR